MPKQLVWFPVVALLATVVLIVLGRIQKARKDNNDKQ
jgi:hypothetical protein